MPIRGGQFDKPLDRLDELLARLTPSAVMRPVIQRWRSDAGALRFHLRPWSAANPVLLAVIGGTGTGKSTLVNRILGVEASATSFRRTFTAGAVAIVRDPDDLPREWLGVQHVVITSDKLPARGENATLIVVPNSVLGQKVAESNTVLNQTILIDTPDLDGDQPVHHAEADRVFRWVQAIIFVVTPEKYQMTELLPYYRLAARYGLPTTYVMNKCEEQAVADDFAGQMAARAAEKSAPTGSVYIVPRDDAAYEPPGGENLAALTAAISQIKTTAASTSEAGLANRAVDLVGRFEDQILGPLRQERQEADKLIAGLRGMETPVPGVDVNPVTQDLERRLQQRSVLYLIGPRRVLDRVRQAPTMLIRLPRTAWDYLMHGRLARGMAATDPSEPGDVPDFKAILTDQFSVLQSRMDDLLGSSAIAQKWMAADAQEYAKARLAPDSAGKIAEEELAELKAWLQKRWNATPRDTRIILSLLKHLPGGARLAALAESAPYLLTIALLAQHTLTHGVDLLVLGGYSAATWISERLSNEVASRTRATNVRISERFSKLAHEQIQNMCKWIDAQAIPPKTVDQIDRAAGDLASVARLTEATP